MPGYDRTGPMGAGPRTGRGLGLCNRPGPESASIEGANLGDAAGGVGRPWRGGRGGGGWGRGRGHWLRGGGGWGRGRVGGGIENLADFDPAPGQTKNFLMQQLEALAARLDELKKLLSRDSPDGKADQGA